MQFRENDKYRVTGFRADTYSTSFGDLNILKIASFQDFTGIAFPPFSIIIPLLGGYFKSGRLAGF